MTDLAILARDAMRPVLAQAIGAALADPAVPVQATGGPIAERAVAAAVAGEAADRAGAALAPLLAHATNGEPWYRSRVTWGAIVAGLAPLAGLFGEALSAEHQEGVVQVLVAAGTLAGAGLALWGRWQARRPIGA